MLSGQPSVHIILCLADGELVCWRFSGCNILTSPAVLYGSNVFVSSGLMLCDGVADIQWSGSCQNRGLLQLFGGNAQAKVFLFSAVWILDKLGHCAANCAGKFFVS